MRQLLSLFVPLAAVVLVGACMRASSGELILFDSERDHGTTGNQSVYLMAPDGSNVRQLAHVEGVTTWLADWSPDRKRIVFSANRTGPWDDLYVVDADGSNVRQLTDTPKASEHDAAWSPDGRHIAYDRAEITADGKRQNAQVWIISEDGTNARPITSGSRNLRPAWSPDGLTIAFMSDRHADVDVNFIGTDDGDLEIYLMDRDGSNTRRLTECVVTAYSPAWSPDGQRIAFGCGVLYVMNADGSGQGRVTNDPRIGGHRSAWSPDGKKIAYGGCVEPTTGTPQYEKHEICVIRADGSGFKLLTKNAVFDGHPDWW